MHIVELTDKVFWIGVGDKNPDQVVGGYGSNGGTTYNSYLIKGENGVAIIDTVKSVFRDLYIDKVKYLCDPQDIKWIIINHIEPDHSGALPWLTEVAPNAKIYLSSEAHHFMHSLFRVENELIDVNDGNQIDIGGLTLRFISAPYLHWPDTMFTYLEEDNILFTCDAFSRHTYPDDLAKAAVAEKYFKSFYDRVMAPFRSNVLDAVTKIKTLPIEVIAPGHGPFLHSDPMQFVDLYEQWSREDHELKDKSIIVMFCGEVPITAQMAATLARGVTAADCHSQIHDYVTVDSYHISKDIKSSDGLILVAPPTSLEPMDTLLQTMEALPKDVLENLPVLVIGAYGFVSENYSRVVKQLKQMGLKVVEVDTGTTFSPQLDDIVALKQVAIKFASRIDD